MNVIKFIKTLADKSPSNIRTQLYKQGILSTYDDFSQDSDKKETDEPGESHATRMIFYTSKNQRFIDNENASELWLECNGLIIDVESLQPVVIPTNSLMHNIDTSVVSANLTNGLYDVYPVNDGTTINMYYWKPLDSWRISTSRSIDATDSQWGETTYTDIIEELMYVAGSDLETFHNSLDKTRCYTFGFKHPSMHSFYAGSVDPVYKMWFIQSVNCTDGDIKCTPDTQTQVDSFETLKISTQSVLQDSDVKKLNSLTKVAHHALYTFLTASEVNYGYILKSRDTSKTGVYSNILLESTLMQKIRHLYYHSKYNKISKQMNYNREKFIIVQSYLDMNTHDLFIELFPRFKPQYNQLNAITSDLVKQTITYTIAKHNNTLTSENKTQDIKHIYDTLNLQYRLNPHDKKLLEIISSFVLNVNFVDVYYNRLDWSPCAVTLKP